MTPHDVRQMVAETVGLLSPEEIVLAKRELKGGRHIIDEVVLAGAKSVAELQAAAFLVEDQS